VLTRIIISIIIVIMDEDDFASCTAPASTTATVMTITDTGDEW
jgi:hypothetical protein